MIRPEYDDVESSESILRVAVSLVIYSNDLSPKDISNALTLEPSYIAEKGVKVGPRTGTIMNVPRNLWELSSEENVHSLTADSHLDWMLSKLTAVQAKLKSLRADPSIDCVFTCVIWTNNDGVYTKLSVRQMAELVSLGFDLRLQVSDYGDN